MQEHLRQQQHQQERPSEPGDLVPRLSTHVLAAESSTVSGLGRMSAAGTTSVSGVASGAATARSRDVTHDGVGALLPALQTRASQETGGGTGPVSYKAAVDDRHQHGQGQQGQGQGQGQQGQGQQGQQGQGQQGQEQQGQQGSQGPRAAKGKQQPRQGKYRVQEGAAAPAVQAARLAQASRPGSAGSVIDTVGILSSLPAANARRKSAMADKPMSGALSAAASAGAKAAVRAPRAHGPVPSKEGGAGKGGVGKLPPLLKGTAHSAVSEASTRDVRAETRAPGTHRTLPAVPSALGAPPPQQHVQQGLDGEREEAAAAAAQAASVTVSVFDFVQAASGGRTVGGSKGYGLPALKAGR